MKKLALLILPLMVLAACGTEPESTVTPSTETPVPTTSTETQNSTNTQSAEIKEDTTKSTQSVEVQANDAGTTAKTTETKTTTPAPLIINMESGNFFFKPATITAKVGQPITVNITNSGFHDFKIDALGVDLDMGNSPSGTITFTPTKAGTFEYYCSVGSHKAMGMKGTLTVTE